MPNRTAKITYTVAGLVVAGLLVGAGSAVATIAGAVPAANTPAATPEATSTSAAQEVEMIHPASGWISPGGGINIRKSDLPKGCTTWSAVSLDGPAQLFGEPVDQGPRSGANGTVNRDADGKIISYTTTEGDNLVAIEGRLCMGTEYMTAYNYVGIAPGMHPWAAGDTFILRPDPTVDWVPPHN